MSWLLVFLGGGLGSVFRFGISQLLIQMKWSSAFPWATFLSNILACAVLALLAIQFNDRLSGLSRLFWMVGFCGGFSTFSTFSIENWYLLKGGNYWLFAANVLLSVAFGLSIFAIFHRSLNA